MIEIEGNSKKVTSYTFGDYWRLLAPGSYYLTVHHPDYIDQRVQVKVTDGAASVVNFELTRKGTSKKMLFTSNDMRKGVLSRRKFYDFFFDTLQITNIKENVLIH